LAITGYKKNRADLVTKMFGGRTHAAVQQLLDPATVSDDELHALRQILDELEARRSEGR